MRKFSPFIALLFLPALVQATPSFTSYSGTLSNGATIFIAGSGMGTKAQAAPLKYETYNNGAFISTWTSANDLVASSITTNASEVRWTGAPYAYAGNIVQNDRHLEFTETNTSYRTWFAQWWIKLSTDFAWGTPCATGFGCANQFMANVKLFRMWDSGSGIENFYMSYDGQGDQLQCIAENIPGENTRYAASGFSTKFSKGKWHLWQVEFQDSSALDVADAIFRCWIDGQIVYNVSGMKTRHAENVFKRPLIFSGFQDEWGQGSNGDYAPNHFWMSEGVVDNTWTRLDLTTCTTYATAGCMAEYQPLVAVTDSSSSFRFNQGNLANGATVYAWWTASDGTRNSSGLKMVVGNTGSGASGGGITNLNPSISGITTSSMTASFTNIGGSTQYQVVFSTDSTFGVISSSGVISSATTGYINLSPTTLYSFEVKNSTDPDNNYAVTSGVTSGGTFNPQGGVTGLGTFSGFGSAYFK